ncbi:MAG: bifunctional nicotinamidase/pyrazinamidase [Cyclobacteriaceae bacterium]|nr:bifunctional nicotinamidase/pyrazinamidase [Cyclobacteriaceae bacterium]
MKALIVVDIQNDFLPGGALAVDKGDEIIPIVNKLMHKFDLVVATQDWHPADHGSFASNHKGKIPGSQILLFGLNQILWPDHCIQNSSGAKFSKELKVSHIDRVFQKGTDILIDSYSGFFDNGKKKDTGLNEYLKTNNVEVVFVVGLATDYCVKFTALDSAQLGYRTYVIQDATRSVNLQEGDFEKSLQEMESKGIGIFNSAEIL